jgi:hypothetical protein
MGCVGYPPYYCCCPLYNYGPSSFRFDTVFGVQIRIFYVILDRNRFNSTLSPKRGLKLAREANPSRIVLCATHK